MTTHIAASRAPRLEPLALRWRCMRALLRVGAALSDGIALGFRHGFDSGPMLDYVYRNRASGAPLIGPLVDRAYLNQIGWRGIRARRALLERTLRGLLDERRARGLPTHIVDIAAGPGRYLLELLASDGGDDLSATLRDLDDAGRKQGRALAQELGLARVRFERGDATDLADLARVVPQPQIVVASGIYEIITDDTAIRRSLGGVYCLLPADGALVFTTQVRHPQLDMIANVLPNRNGEPWVMGTRPTALVEEWARAACFRDVSTQDEEHGLFAVTVARGGGR